MTPDKFLQHMEARYTRRLASEHRALCNIEHREEIAAAMIGCLMRDGQIVYYVSPQGGRHIIEGKRLDLIAYLIRNGYA